MLAEKSDTSSIEKICQGERLLAIIIPGSFSPLGVNFVTPHNLSQQVAFIQHEAGRLIEPHVHIPVQREVMNTQEVLVIKNGALRVDFYGDDHVCLQSRVLTAGDVILLAEGGHGFEVLEALEMIEVKQGPYTGEKDKIRFGGKRCSAVESVNPSQGADT